MLLGETGLHESVRDESVRLRLPYGRSLLRHLDLRFQHPDQALRTPVGSAESTRVDVSRVEWCSLAAGARTAGAAIQARQGFWGGGILSDHDMNGAQCKTVASCFVRF